MRNLNKFIISLTALAIVIGVGMYLNHRPDPPAPQPDHPGNVMAPTTNRPIVHAQRPFLASESPQGTKPTNFLTLPPEKVEEYLQRHNRDAASLLAGFHVLHDTNLLYEAVTNFPNDPHLQWTVLARNLFPEDRRKWLDNFKTLRAGQFPGKLSVRQRLFSESPTGGCYEGNQRGCWQIAIRRLLDGNDFG